MDEISIREIAAVLGVNLRDAVERMNGGGASFTVYVDARDSVADRHYWLADVPRALGMPAAKWQRMQADHDIARLSAAGGCLRR